MNFRITPGTFAWNYTLTVPETKQSSSWVTIVDHSMQEKTTEKALLDLKGDFSDAKDLIQKIRSFR